MKKTFNCLFLLFYLIACKENETNREETNNLTREKAEELIKAQSQYPRFQYLEIDTLESSTRQRVFKDLECVKERVQATFYSDKISEKYLKLENAGLINLDYNNFWSEEPKGSSGGKRCGHLEHEYFRDLYTHVTFTEKAAPFLQGSFVKVATTDFEQITGLIDNGSGTAEVEFNEITRTTPFGVVLGYEESRMKRRVNFTKYDDGWRLTNTLDYPTEYKADPSMKLREQDRIQVNAGTIQSQSTLNVPANSPTNATIVDSIRHNTMATQKGTVISQANNSGQYTVSNNKTHFHDAPDFATQRKAYLIYGETVNVQKVQSGFGYVEFTNGKGKTSSGWLEMSTLTVK